MKTDIASTRISRNSHKIILLSVISLTLNYFVISGFPRSVSRLVGGLIGTAITLSICSVILGLIPYYFSDNKSVDSKISIFGKIFIFTCLITIVGTIWKQLWTI